MSNTKTTKSAQTVAPNWMRSLMLVLADEQGFTHSQTATYVDVFTKKGHAPVVLTWSAARNGHLLAVASGKTLIEGKTSMLQRAQTMLGKPIDLGRKWGRIADAKKAELVAFGASRLKVIAPANA